MQYFPGAMAIGIPFQPRADVVAAVLPLALAVGHALTDADPASDLDRILLHIGRSPGWAA